jgi:hypothetical protein
VKSEQLLTQGKIFEDDILAGPECTNHPAEEVPEPYDHAQNLTGTLSIELGAKSLILRVYDVLMNDSPRSLTKVHHGSPATPRRNKHGNSIWFAERSVAISNVNLDYLIRHPPLDVTTTT